MDVGVVNIFSLGIIDLVVVDWVVLVLFDELFLIMIIFDQVGCCELKVFGLIRIGDFGVLLCIVWIEVIGLVVLLVVVLLWMLLSLLVVLCCDRFMMLVCMGCDFDWCGQVFVVEVFGIVGLGVLFGLVLFIFV